MNQSQIIAQCKPCLFFLGECKWAIPDQCKHYVGSRIFLARLYLLGGQWPQRSSSNFPFPSFIRKKKKKVSFPVECLCFTYWLCSEFHSSRSKKIKKQKGFILSGDLLLRLFVVSLAPLFTLQSISLKKHLVVIRQARYTLQYWHFPYLTWFPKFQ